MLRGGTIILLRQPRQGFFMRHASQQQQPFPAGGANAAALDRLLDESSIFGPPLHT